jgi:uncharacterized protein YcfJ
MLPSALRAARTSFPLHEKDSVMDPRTAILITASALAAIVGGYLGTVVWKGTQKQKLAAGVIAGFVAFAGAYNFLDGIVDRAVAPATPASRVTSAPPTPSP